MGTLQSAESSRVGVDWIILTFITVIFLQSEMKVLVISLLLVDFLHGSYVGSRPKCSTVTRDVCTDTVVKECDNPKETSVPAKECHSDYETKCHTVLESVCHDETVPVCETKLDQMCQIEDKTERNTVTRTQCDTMYNQECSSVPEVVCKTVQVPVVNTVQECHTEERTE